MMTIRMSGVIFFFFSSRRRHTRFDCDWSSDVCSSDLDLGSPRYPTDHEIVEGGDGIGFRPQAHLPRSKATIAMIEEERAVQMALDPVADGDHTDRMPLAEGRRLDRRARQLMPPTVVVVQSEVVLEGVGSNDVVPPIREAEHDAAGRVLPPGDRFEAYGNVSVGVGPAWGDDHVEGVLRGSLDEDPLATWRACHLLDRPASIDDSPPLDALRLEIEPLDRQIGR